MLTSYATPHKLRSIRNHRPFLGPSTELRRQSHDIHSPTPRNSGVEDWPSRSFCSIPTLSPTHNPKTIALGAIPPNPPSNNAASSQQEWRYTLQILPRVVERTLVPSLTNRACMWLKKKKNSLWTLLSLSSYNFCRTCRERRQCENLY